MQSDIDPQTLPRDRDSLELVEQLCRLTGASHENVVMLSFDELAGRRPDPVARTRARRLGVRVQNVKLRRPPRPAAAGQRPQAAARPRERRAGRAHRRRGPPSDDPDPDPPSPTRRRAAEAVPGRGHSLSGEARNTPRAALDATTTGELRYREAELLEAEWPQLSGIQRVQRVAQLEITTGAEVFALAAYFEAVGDRLARRRWSR